MGEEPLRSVGVAQTEEQAALAGAGAVDADLAAEYAELGQRVGELIERLETHPDRAVGEQLDELLIAFDHLHRDMLRRLTGLLAHHELLGHALTDPLVAMVLDLYDLRPGGVGAPSGDGDGPAPAPTRAARPATPSPLIRLQDIRRFPIATMPAAAVPPAAGPTVLENVLGQPNAEAPATPPVAAPARQPVPSPPPVDAAKPRRAALLTDDSGAVVPADGPAEWTSVFAVESAPAGALVASADAEIVICNVGGALHALRNRCGGTPLPLHFGEITGERLVCPWHRGCDYDAATGESSSGRRTVVYPIRVDGDRISVALNHGRSTGPLQPTGLRAAPM